MREFDHTGLQLAEYQGKLFQKSCELDCSTAIFLRRFLHSELLKTLDTNNPSLFSPNVDDGIKLIENQFGKSTYGKNKLSESALFWIGYIYRYIAYTREQSTKFIMDLFPYKKMDAVYYTYHTQDPEWVIRSLLESQGLSEAVFDNNARLKMIIKEAGKY